MKMSKTCLQCHITKPLSEFRTERPFSQMRGNTVRGTRNKCKDCSTKLKKTAMRLKQMYIKQYGKIPTNCECCGCSSKLVCDHEHNLETFRGFLCDNCNRGIGLLGDNVDGILLALKYLQKSR